MLALEGRPAPGPAAKKPPWQAVKGISGKLAKDALVQFPAVVGGLYAVLPDLMAGPGDDVAVLALGAVISGIWSWRRSRRGDLPAEIEIIEKKKEAA